MTVSESQQRLSSLAQHLMAPSGAPAKAPASPEDVVIVAAVRTPLSRARKGPLAGCHQEYLLSCVLKAVIDRTGINPALVEDVQVGNVLPPGGGATVSRMAQLHAGFPVTTSIMTVNRQCSSGLQACASIVAAIKTGVIEIGIGAGVEQMSLNYGPGAMPSSLSEQVLAESPLAADCLMPMGMTSENVASRFGVNRQKQDQFAASSHCKAAQAQQNGWFRDEIVPVKVRSEDGSTETVVSADDGIRAKTTPDLLAKLKPAFKEDGTTTAGNASQVTDGAAAVLLMKRRRAEQLKLPIIGRWISFAVAGCPPDVMGIGPAVAIPKALEKAGLSVADVDIYEINEAFASQCVYSVETLKIPYEKVNPKGGAIALGHPLGCTGARQIATLLPELKRQGKRYGCVSMCIGTGMGAAAIIERQ